MYDLELYSRYDYPMDRVLDAVEDAIPLMKPNKKYELKNIVELSKPGFWDKLTNYQRRCVGATFISMYNAGKIDGLSVVDPYKKPLKYVKDN